MPEIVYDGPDGVDHLEIEEREFTERGNAIRVVVGEDEEGHKEFREIPWGRIYFCDWSEAYRTAFERA